ncbi:hypothetical protein F5Y14DRAFT_406300 [Nemania sp. NC0429]|nr:hypothetical protein F5Y14DRAFT_406300 [Nemania sp. NC0429]
MIDPSCSALLCVALLPSSVRSGLPCGRILLYHDVPERTDCVVTRAPSGSSHSEREKTTVSSFALPPMQHGGTELYLSMSAARCTSCAGEPRPSQNWACITTVSLLWRRLPNSR